MKLRPDQLRAHLAGELSPVYLLGGDEPLQLEEAADALRAAARSRGYTERQVFHVDQGFDWNRLAAEADSLSLFAERRIIELRLAAAGPGRDGGQALSDYADRPPPDVLLLVVAPRLDGAAKRSRWFRRLEQLGVVIQVWPIGPERLAGWMQRRLGARGLSASDAAVAMLAERVEGNLLAAAQEVEKLALLCPGGRIDERDVAAAVGDSARFDIFELAAAALEGDADRCLRILAALRGEAVHPNVLVWLLDRELHLLSRLARGPAADLDRRLESERVWQNRRPAYRRALRRLDPARLARLVQGCARCDRLSKGQERGDPWVELIDLWLSLAGTPGRAATPAARGPAAYSY